MLLLLLLLMLSRFLVRQVSFLFFFRGKNTRHTHISYTKGHSSYIELNVINEKKKNWNFETNKQNIDDYDDDDDDDDDDEAITDGICIKILPYHRIDWFEKKENKILFKIHEKIFHFPFHFISIFDCEYIQRVFQTITKKKNRI